ncbi:MAG: V-type ATP synthase subunit K [Christensenellaceae bacterium]|jgi:V/A-type H+-transporting ATPase subunit K|nr:V-type ATP synthase subunit K [Christensenellaceae bacterium]
MWGNVLAILGASLAVGLCGLGASIGLSIVQRASAGLVSEQPEKYTKTLVFQLIPSTAALYGFVVGFLVLQNVVMGNAKGYTTVEGAMVLAACLPIAIVGMVSAIAQAKVCASMVNMIGKRNELYGRGITMAIFIEFFALLGLIISILSVLSI